MGAEPYSYWVPFEKDINAALQKLRQQEFQAGRYRVPSDLDEDESTLNAPRHASIDEAIEAGEADGTSSILDILAVGPSPDFNTAGPLTRDELIALFGTATPSRSQIEEAEGELFEGLDRGQCV